MDEKVENFFNKAMDNDVEFQKLINSAEKEKQRLIESLEVIKEGNKDGYLLIEIIDEAIEYIKKVEQLEYQNKILSESLHLCSLSEKDLRNRIDKVVNQCAVTWINDTLKGR